MNWRTQCTQCEAIFDAGEESMGRTIRCPRCKELTKVPTKRLPVRARSERDDDDRPRRRRDDDDRDDRDKSNAALLRVGLGAGAVGLIALAVLLLFMMLRKPAQSEVADNTNKLAQEVKAKGPDSFAANGNRISRISDLPPAGPPPQKVPTIPAVTPSPKLVTPIDLPPKETARVQPSNKPLLVLTGHTGPVNSVAFSADGKKIVSGSEDKTLIVWDATTGQALQRLQGHKEGVTGVAWSPDGSKIVSASEDGTLKVWDPANGHDV